MAEDSEDVPSLQRPLPSENVLRIPKNRSTGDLLSSTAGAGKSLFIRTQSDDVDKGPFSPPFLASSTGPNTSGLLLDNEHNWGLGISGLRRIRQHPASSRTGSCAPTAPASPTRSHNLPARSASMTLDSDRLMGNQIPLSPYPSLSPNPQVTDDLARFPSESLHSFSFSPQSEDVVHNRQGVLRRAVEYMRDRMGWGANHPSVMAAQAKVRCDADVQSMIDLVIQANLAGGPPHRRSTTYRRASHGSGDMLDPSRNSRSDHISSNINGNHDLGASHSRHDDDPQSSPQGASMPHVSSDEKVQRIEASTIPFSSINHRSRVALKRSLTDISLKSLEGRLLDALAKPNFPGNQCIGTMESASKDTLASNQNFGQLGQSLVHGHNNRSFPASQAVFTTEASSPWTILAANDLACLVFGVTLSEVKRLGMLEFVHSDQRDWLRTRLHDVKAKASRVSGENVKTSPRLSSTSLMGNGITATLLGRPSWRSRKSDPKPTCLNGTSNATHDTKPGNKAPGVILCGDIVPIHKRNGVAAHASLWVKEKRGGLIWILEEVMMDTTWLQLDEDANVIKHSKNASMIWGQIGPLPQAVSNFIPRLPLIDGFAVDKTALEASTNSKHYTARAHDGTSVPVAVHMSPASRILRVSSIPNIAGMVVASASDLSIISANNVFASQLFGKDNLSGQSLTSLLPHFDAILARLIDQEELMLDAGVVIPEHKFRSAVDCLVSQGQLKDMTSQSPLLAGSLSARHRDGTEIAIDVQMRLAYNNPESVSSTAIAEQPEDADEDSTFSEETQLVYALWITYTRQSSASVPLDSVFDNSASHSSPTIHRPSPGQTTRFELSSRLENANNTNPSSISPTSSSQKIDYATTQPSAGIVSEKHDETTRSYDHSRTSSKSSIKKSKKQISDYSIIEDMGEGAYGQVKLARDTNGSGQRVVIKYVTKRRILVDTWTRDRRLGTVPLEIHVLDYLRRDGLRHPNIVEMTDFFEDDINYYIEMVPHGLPGMDLFDYIEMRATMDEEECRNIFRQVVAAIHHLHTVALVVHRDIKDENIILDGDGNVKLIDFGSAAYIKSGPFDVFVGTIDYAAPEVLQGHSYNGKEQDIWALGILLYTLVYKENPFYSIDEILDHELRIPFILSASNIDIIQAMLNRDVDQRLEIGQVMAHQWCRPAGLI